MTDSVKVLSLYLSYNQHIFAAQDHEEKRTSHNLKKGRIYYDIDGRRKPVPHRVANDEGYLDREEQPTSRTRDTESGDEKVPDWLK